MPIGKNIEYLLQLNKMTMRDLADKIGIDISTLARIINGSTHNPRYETVSTIAKFFNVEVSELVNEEYSRYFRINSSELDYHNASIKEVLKKLMEKTGVLSISLLQKYTEIPKSVLSDILNGKTEKPNLKTLEKLSEYFNVSILQLCGKEPISKYKVLSILPKTVALPLILFEQIQEWIDGRLLNDQISYINVNDGCGMDIKSFACKINGNQYEPELEMGCTVIVRSVTDEIPDFSLVLGKYKNKISIFEIENTANGYVVRESGQFECIYVSRLDFLPYGIIVKTLYT